MHRSFSKICTLVLLLWAFHLETPRWAQAMPEDAILAVVNDDVITYRDLSEYLHSRYLQLKMEGIPENEIKSMMGELEANGIRRIIQDKLIVAEADRKGLQVRTSAVDERIQKIEKNYPSEEIFLKALEQDGISLSDLRRKVENQIKVQQMIETEIKNKIYVNPQEVTDYYTAHLAEFKKPEQIQLDSIFLAKGTDPRFAKAKAQEALKFIEAGGGFRDIAQKYSQTPALGTFERNKLLAQLESVAWTLAVGKVSGVIEVENGFYIIKVLGKTPAETATLDETKERIQQIVFNERFRQKLEDWLAELEKKSFIEIKTEGSP